MIGPSCAGADVEDTRATIWSGPQWPQRDRSDISSASVGTARPSMTMTMTIDGAAADGDRIKAFDYLRYLPSCSMGEKGDHLAWHLIGRCSGLGAHERRRR